MRYPKLIQTLFVVCSIFIMTSAACAAEIVIDHNKEYQETVYSLENNNCKISLTAYHSDLNKHVLRYRTDCTTPLSQQVPLLEKLLKSVLKETGSDNPFQTLFWGRLNPDTLIDAYEMGYRLALAAFQSPDWDNKKGKPVKGHENDFVKMIANQELIYDELKSLFEKFKIKIEFSSAEKVLIFKAKKMPCFERLKKYGVNPDDRLPFDCLTWFSLKKYPGL